MGKYVWIIWKSASHVDDNELLILLLLIDSLWKNAINVLPCHNAVTEVDKFGFREMFGKTVNELYENKWMTKKRELSSKTDKL